MVEHIFRCESYSRSLTHGIEDMCALMPADWYGTLHEEIVRCRDCIYYTKDPDPIDPGWPMMCERTVDDKVEPYGFCAWGARREP